MTKRQIYLTMFFGIIFSVGLYDYLSNWKANQKLMAEQEMSIPNAKNDNFYKNKKEKLALAHKETDETSQLIDELTNEHLVINYVKKHHELPGYYITKSSARKQGWNPSQGNLCDVLPGKAIGGDRFGNREGKLPEGNQYYEADVNYKCGRRNADRIIFTKKGEVWLTKDHYKTFVKINH